MEKYSKSLLNKRKFLRHNATSSEKVIWEAIRAKKLGVKFRRQVSIGPYIVDFACINIKLIIEIDGGYHEDPVQFLNDVNRDHNLEKSGYTILRFTNDDVFYFFGDVVSGIKTKVDELIS